MYVLNLDKDTNRVLSVGKMPHPPAGAVLVDTLPDDDITDYLYVDGAYVYNPLPEPEQPEPTPTNSERITALEDTITALIGGIMDVQ